MIGLWWFKPSRVKIPTLGFTRKTIAFAIWRIAGIGHPDDYLQRAGRMISSAKKRGEIDPVNGCRNRYIFKVPT